MIRRAALALLVTVAPALGREGAGDEAAGDVVALKAGTIHLVEGQGVIEGGGTILVRDGRIAAVGAADLALPPGTRVFDYGPGAVIAPGLVAANSMVGPGSPSERTIDPGTRAVDNFDPRSSAWAYDLAGGITTLYLPPTRGRLIGGQAAVVKLAGEGERVLLESAALHGTIGADARGVGGYWEPPVPATVDIGLGVEQRQLPGSTMGAVLALRELLDEARAGSDSGEYGPGTPAEVAAHLRAGTPWRLTARTEAEIRALLELARSEHLPLVIEGADEAAGLAREIQAAGVGVVVTVDVAPGAPGRDFGKRRDARWPTYSAAQALSEAGVRLAIATPDNLRARDLRFAAAVASRGGLDEAEALRAITLGAAELLGVADRVGSIAVGKHADFAVFTGPPMEMTSSVVATWVEGALVFTPPSEPAGKKAAHRPAAERSRAVVIEADELHLGDGEVLRPGAVLIVDGKIAEVGESVARPFGADLASGPVAMPGLVDAFGHLGLEGSAKAPDADFKLARLIEPGDFADRRVARAGITTVVMTPRVAGRTGTPMMAYKPASADLESMVVEDPAGLRLLWSDVRDRSKSGEDVKKLLEKVLQYDAKWKEYEKALAEWVPPPPGAEEDEKAEAGDEDEKKEESADEDEAEDDKPKNGEDEKGAKGAGAKQEPEKDSKKKKKDEEAGEEIDPLTGVWDAELVLVEGDEPEKLRLRLSHRGGEVAGTLRCAALSTTLVAVTGTLADEQVELVGVGSRGFIQVRGALEKEKLAGQVTLDGEEYELDAERTSREYAIAGRPELRKAKVEEPPEVKGKPKSPGIDEKLEPLRAALRGEKAVVVEVDRELEILECVEAFADAGIKPVLYGAPDAWRVVDEIRGRVAGVLLGQAPLRGDPREGLAGWKNTYQELSTAGIPVAFHSDAEEGASELWLQAAYCVSQGLSPAVALRGLTSESAAMLGIGDRVGRLAPGLDGDVLLLDGPPLEASTSVLRVWVAGQEVR